MTDSKLLRTSIFRPKPVEISPRLLRQRKQWDKIFYGLGKSAVIFSCLILLGILGSIVYWALPAFVSVELKITVPIQNINDLPNHLKNNRSVTFQKSLLATYPALKEKSEYRAAGRLYSILAQKKIEHAVKNALKSSKNTPQTLTLWVKASPDVAVFLKRDKDSTSFKNQKSFRLTEFQRHLLKTLEKNGYIRYGFNLEFFTFSDSQTPELAGIYGAFIGSIYVLGVALLFALPIGVLTAIYLEEFSRDTRLNRFLEINLNNLAAVPSVVFGLLGLSVFLNLFKLPRSSALIGGLTLGLMLFPIIIVSSRSALRSIPISIRDAARGLGASPVQVVFHHVFPVAFPGILTGSLIAIARAMGESASLLMVGMMAFLTVPPRTIFSPATTLPVEIYQWVERPERGFDELSSAAILFLLILLGILNWTALFLKRKYEKKW